MAPVFQSKKIEYRPSKVFPYKQENEFKGTEVAATVLHKNGSQRFDFIMSFQDFCI